MWSNVWLTATNSPSKDAASFKLSRLLASMRGATLKLNELHWLLDKGIRSSFDDMKRLVYS